MSYEHEYGDDPRLSDARPRATMITPWDLIARLQEQVDDLLCRVAALESSPSVSDAE